MERYLDLLAKTKQQNHYSTPINSRTTKKIMVLSPYISVHAEIVWSLTQNIVCVFLIYKYNNGLWDACEFYSGFWATWVLLILSQSYLKRETLKSCRQLYVQQTMLTSYQQEGSPSQKKTSLSCYYFIALFWIFSFLTGGILYCIAVVAL